jgi:ELP3 family radical SAM enzyme/protein acetyltransferase
MIGDIEDVVLGVSNTQKVSNLLVHNINNSNSNNVNNIPVIKQFIKDIIAFYVSDEYDENEPSKKTWKILYRDLSRVHSINPSVVVLNYYYFQMLQTGELLERCPQFEINNKGKQSRGSSGITQITVLSSPYPNGQEFSCEYNCYYCPNEPAHEDNGWQAQPRSYLYNEPAVRRANTNGFDAARQMWDRMSALLLCGLRIDKLEVMVLGGTWSSYPESYREEFVRDLYYAANTFYDDMIIDENGNQTKRERWSLEEEIVANQTAQVRVIGLTLETRPDCITARELELLRRYNCTRVQIGVQHTNDRILAKVNRASYLADTKRAIANLLNVGLKVDIHLMFDLPYATQQDDFDMIDLLLKLGDNGDGSSDLRFDQVKFYPFSSLDWTKTKEWEDAGKDLHYTGQELIEVILYAKKNIPEWVRINRVIRDIPSDYITAGNDIPNLRQEIHREMAVEGWSCCCIRCREPKNNKDALSQVDNAELVVRNYEASDGIEYFISYESPDRRWIYGFCRLRLSYNAGYVLDLPPTIHRTRNDIPVETLLFPQLKDSALIRELHVYGMMDPVASNSNRIQHRGFGKLLVKKAEELAVRHGFYKMSIISGVGVREYYEKKLGYTLNGTYMEKKISEHPLVGFLSFITLLIILVKLGFILYNFF